MHALLNVAVMAARRAGAVLGRNFKKLNKLKVEMKGHNDYVSDADLAAETAIIDIIKKHYPEHAILAEESGASGESDTVWIIDPLDGTTNFRDMAVSCLESSHNAKSPVFYRPGGQG